MRELVHTNLNTFIGAVYEPPLFFIVTEYCPKGALKVISRFIVSSLHI